ncbi:MAG: hypothetical protein ACYCTE_16270, partial [Acidimicrobiales bacterium]
MPGMGKPLELTNPTIALAFQSALLRQSLYVVVVLVMLAVAWNVLRATQRARSARGTDRATATAGGEEPPARRVLRVA